MEQLVQLGLNGLALGCVYALVALGMILVYEASGVVNFATGQFVMVGTFVAATSYGATGLPAIPAYMLALAGMAAFGIGFFFSVHRPLQKHSIVTIIIGTVAVGIVVQNVAQMIWGPLPIRPVSPFGRAVVEVAGARVTVHVLSVIAVTVVLVAALTILLMRTPLGVRMRAVAQDPEAARLMGVSVTFIHGLTWVIAAVLAGMAGIMLGPIWFPDVGMGDAVALKAFAAAIIGGFGSVPGAIIGGILVGLAEVLGAYYISSTYKELIVFGLMVGFLLIYPQGLFGEKVGERG
jgi:branched-chain amino acid transport system permease protein